MTIFVEGGNRGALNSECRRGFRALIEKALPTGCRLKFDIRPCGSRNAAFDNFRLALENGETDVVLLVDGEDVIANPAAQTRLTRDPWQHFVNRGDPWTRPARATNDQTHLMAVSMETWLVADSARLAAYYGQGFQASALSANTQLENVAKPTLNQSLVGATRNTSKGEYRKGSHSFYILATLDPAELELRLPHAKSFFDFLRAHC